jgi:MYXO-CTERM domain-containing protein
MDETIGECVPDGSGGAGGTGGTGGVGGMGGAGGAELEPPPAVFAKGGACAASPSQDNNSGLWWVLALGLVGHTLRRRRRTRR